MSCDYCGSDCERCGQSQYPRDEVDQMIEEATEKLRAQLAEALAELDKLRSQRGES